MTPKTRTLVALLPLALAVACGDAAKKPAEAAMAAATAAMDGLKGDAVKYAPDAVKGVEASYLAAKAALGREDYKAALAAAGEVPAKAKAALATATSRKDELVKAWNEASLAVPQAVSDARARVTALAGARKLPKGLDRAAVEKAGASVAALEASWKQAADRAAAGDYVGALGRTRDLKAQAEALLASLAGK